VDQKLGGEALNHYDGLLHMIYNASDIIYNITFR